MKPTILIVLFILLTSSAVFAQSECEKASEKAKSDFKNSRFSLHSKEILPNEATFYYILKTDYGISSYTTDSLDFYGCYDSTMKELLKGKYGKEFFQRTKNIADSLENTENWKKDAEFPGGPNAMHKFIIDRLSLAYIKKENQFLDSLTCSGDRTRTYGLRVMSPTSYQLLHPAMSSLHF